jgi:hypothetical protein
VDRISDRIGEALGVDQAKFCRGTRPATYVGRGISAPTNPRNSVASGQFAANASPIRLAVSLIRTAIFSNRSRMVENWFRQRSRQVAISEMGSPWHDSCWVREQGG